MSEKIVISLTEISKNIIKMIETEKAWSSYSVLNTEQKLDDNLDTYLILAKGEHSIRGEENIAFFIINDSIRSEKVRKERLVRFRNNCARYKLNIIYLVTDIIRQNGRVLGNSISKKLQEMNKNSENSGPIIYPLSYMYFYGFYGVSEYTKDSTYEYISGESFYKFIDIYPENNVYPEDTISTCYTNIGREMIYLNLICENVFIKRTSKASGYGNNSSIFRTRVNYNLYNSSANDNNGIV